MNTRYEDILDILGELRQMYRHVIQDPGFNPDLMLAENTDRAFSGMRLAYQLAISILDEHEQPGYHSWSPSSEQGLDFEAAACDTCVFAREALHDLGCNIPEMEAVKRQDGHYPLFHIWFHGGIAIPEEDA